MLSLLGLVILLVVLVNLSPVQNFLVRRATSVLSDKLKTTVRIDNIRIDFLNHLLVEGLYIEDQSKDTLLYAGKVEVRITDWFFVKKEKPVIKYVGLHNAYGHLYRTDKSEVWNYQFVVDAFDTGKPNKDTTKTQNEFELDLKKLDIQNVRFHMDDAWVGSDMDIDIGDLQLDAEEIDLKKKSIKVDGLDVERFAFVMRDYEGGRPPRVKTRKPADTTSFNPDDWHINFKQLNLEDCDFKLTSSSKPAPANEFDPEHLYISNIQLEANNIGITGDTLHGKIKHLAANERCGLNIKELRANVTVSPVASICEDLYLETDRSLLQDYYAMHYHRFPDFNDYIMNVRMEANFKNSHLDSRDVAYFAPALKEYPTVVQMSGHIKGSVFDIEGRNLFLSDGRSTVKGNLRMTGLPDIETTFIDYSEGELMSTGEGILKYAPGLRNSPDIALEKLSYIYFKGSYRGYIESFAANGVLSTNLGTVVSDIRLSIPDFNTNTAAYSGTVSTENFNLGALLRQPDLGTLTFKGTVKGNSFDPNIAQIEINATIGHIRYNNYDYKNIYAEGTLAKKRFDGKLIVDDPNLAMGFNGSFDFNDNQPKINATANVLSSDLKALNLVKDSMTLVADFDLNATATNIDDFIGTARLYNINLNRYGHRLDVDSIYLNSSVSESGEKYLIVESNDVSARLSGKYELSSLPYSVQYYVSGYLPNYISPPTHQAPDQDIKFTVETKVIDSILAVLAPSVSGFDHTVLTGALNTAQQKLSLNLLSASGSVGTVKMNDIALSGEGDFRRLSLTGNVAHIVVGDSVVDGSLSLKTSLGNDSLNFTIATSSEGNYGTATLNGNAYASGDSLYMTLLPSEFYLNKHRWEIPSGSNIILSNDFLYVNNLFLQSGLQKVAIKSLDELSKQSLNIKVENLDMQELGAVAGLDEYEAEGRVDGELQIDNVFRSQYFSARLRGTGIKIAGDTLGSIIVSGNFDEEKGLFLDPESGIYNGNASVSLFGKIRSDSTSSQKLDGGIRFFNAPLSWAESIMSGYLSGIEGTVSGEIALGGTGLSPDMKGNLYLSKVSTKVEFLGLTYRIPEATIKIDEKKIDIGDVIVLDPNDNIANLSGIITHDRFEKMRLSFSMRANQFEVIDLKEYESSVFYGNLTAKIERFNLTGPPNDIRIDITATPINKSHLYLPVDQGSDVGTYNYISFKQYGQVQTPVGKRNDNKVTMVINANLTPDGEITMVIDPTTGDAINAAGYGNLKINIPIGGDITMYGDYLLERGSYTFTFNQLFFRRTFALNNGSRISFKGPLAETSLNVEGIYTTKARLYDLLTDGEKQTLGEEEAKDSKTPQNVDVKLHMGGTLEEPRLTFGLDLQETRSMGTLAYEKLKTINKNDRELLDQVATLLLVNTFISPQGMSSGTSVGTVAINNVSDMLSSTASTQLTNIVNKLLGNPNLTIDLKYKNYNLSDAGNTGLNRNEVTTTVTKNFLQDKLIVEVGGSYDWGRPSSGSATSNTFNLAGDFRLQWLLNQKGSLRLNLFRTSNYDVLSDQNISRGGLGLSWRKSFDGLGDFFNSNTRKRKMIGPEPYKADSNGTR